jgi:hypothetical protein
MKKNAPLRWALFIGTIAMSPIYAGVVVPGYISGGFGNPVDVVNPFINAFTVSGPLSLPVSLTISPSGCVVDYLEDCIDYHGVPWNEPGTTTPMQEAGVVVGYPDNTLDALIAAFVPEAIVNDPNFQAIDSHNPACSPGLLFYASQNNGIVDIGEPGTLFLGLNDFFVGDNAGSFNVEVSETQAATDTPEPGTIGLLGVGLAGIVARRFRG